MTEYALVNFKMNPATKTHFKTICDHNHMNMTAVINAFIKDFVAKNNVSLKKPMFNPEDDDHALDFFFVNDDHAEPRL